jgi:hypothetical protein
MTVFKDAYNWAGGAIDTAGDVADKYLFGQSDREKDPRYNWDAANAMRGYGMQARSGQDALAGRLNMQAQGQGPSVAQAQLNQARDANIQQYNAQAASARGGAAAHMLAQRQAADNAAQAQQQTAGQAAGLRAQEVAQANQQLSATLEHQRAADLQAADMEDKRQLGVGQQGVQMADVNAGISKSNATNASGAMGGMMGMAGSLLGLLSDKRSKQNVAPADREIRGFMDAIHPEKYAYRSDPEITHYGVMAQDMEHSPVGRTAVREIDGYKRIDPNEAQTITLAALANLNKRLAAMEKT